MPKIFRPLRKPTKKELNICRKILKLFKIDGETADNKITGGQLEIFWALVFQKHKRVQIESCTQYGKSLTVALACIVISCIEGEIVSVIAPTSEKAKEIMRYYIQHLGDNVIFFSQLEKKTKLDRLRQEGSKERIILRNGGGIFIVSVDQRNAKKSIEAAMGKGCKITILDEGCLVQDATEATIFRMLAGKGKDAFYCKIGNPFYSQPPYSHFKKSSDNPKYYKIWIDYKQAIDEGRYTDEFIDEARTKPLFGILYEVKFPDEDGMDARGYQFLFPNSLLENAFVDKLPEELKGSKRLGSDIGEGNNSNAHVIRYDNVMWLEDRNRSNDVMTQVPVIEKINPDEGFVDRVGVGAGVASRCIEKDLNVIGIAWGTSAEDSTQFANLKAENYWNFKTWIEEGGKILRHECWDELRQIKYKVTSNRRIQIEPKEELRERGIESPDVADGGALTFNKLIKPTIDFI